MKPQSIAINVRQPAGSLVGIKVTAARGQITLEISRVPEKAGTGYIEPPKTITLRPGSAKKRR